MTPIALDYIVMDRFKWSGMHCSSFGLRHNYSHRREADEKIMCWQRWCKISTGLKQCTSGGTFLCVLKIKKQFTKQQETQSDVDTEEIHLCVTMVATD